MGRLVKGKERVRDRKKEGQVAGGGEQKGGMKEKKKRRCGIGKEQEGGKG